MHGPMALQPTALIAAGATPLSARSFWPMKTKSSHQSSPGPRSARRNRPGRPSTRRCRCRCPKNGSLDEIVAVEAEVFGDARDSLDEEPRQPLQIGDVADLLRGMRVAGGEAEVDRRDAGADQ